MDNLDSQTYETFEKDPVKYTLYEKVLMVQCGQLAGFIVLLGNNRGPEGSRGN